jgi:hypothetical protein
LSGPKLQGGGPIRSFEEGEEPKMSDSALFVGWNQPARGREAGAVAAFGEGVQYFGELAARGDIESFEPFFLDAHGGDLNGFFLVRGERASLDRLRYDDERFRSWIIKAQLNVDGIGVLGAVTGETLGQQMAVFTETVAGLD